MHRLDCDEYVDMGEHNKPLCKKNGYRPAECELCPMRVAALEAENAKLRELVRDLSFLADDGLMELCDDEFRDIMGRIEDLGGWPTSLKMPATTTNARTTSTRR